MSGLLILKLCVKNKTVDESTKKAFIGTVEDKYRPKSLGDRHSFVVFEKEFSSEDGYSQMAAMSKQTDKIL